MREEKRREEKRREEKRREEKRREEKRREEKRRDHLRREVELSPYTPVTTVTHSPFKFLLIPHSLKRLKRGQIQNRSTEREEAEKMSYGASTPQTNERPQGGEDSERDLRESEKMSDGLDEYPNNERLWTERRTTERADEADVHGRTHVIPVIKLKLLSAPQATGYNNSHSCSVDKFCNVKPRITFRFLLQPQGNITVYIFKLLMLTLFYIFDVDSPFYFITTQVSLWFMITLCLPNLTQPVQNDSCASSTYVIYFQKMYPSCWKCPSGSYKQ